MASGSLIEVPVVEKADWGKVGLMKYLWGIEDGAMILYVPNSGWDGWMDPRA